MSTATPMPRSAQSASAEASRSPSPSDSRNRATERTPSEPAQGAEPVARVADRLVAGRDDGVEADPAPRAERVDGDVAALGDHRDAPGPQRLDRVAPQRGAGVEADDAVAVRPADGQGAGERRLAQLALEPAAGLDLAEAGGDDDRAAAAERRRLGDHRGDPGGRDRDGDRVDGARAARRAPARRGPRGSARGSGSLPRPRPRSRAARGCAAACRRRSRRGRWRRRPRSRRVGAGARGRRRSPRARRPYWSSRSTPRRSIPRAMIRRWISLVPSQIRSTRSSRSRRSATFERR